MTANLVSYKALPFDEASHIGGILPIKVSNVLDISSGKTLTFDASASASASGRSLSIFYPTCPTWARCAKLTAAASGGTATSGGIMLTWINQVNTSAGASSSSSLQFAAKGLPGGQLSGGSGGYIENKIRFVNNLDTLNLEHFTSGGTGTTAGGPGNSYFQFCQNSQYPLTLSAVSSTQNCIF